MRRARALGPSGHVRTRGAHEANSRLDSLGGGPYRCCCARPAQQRDRRKRSGARCLAWGIAFFTTTSMTDRSSATTGPSPASNRRPRAGRTRLVLVGLVVGSLALLGCSGSDEAGGENGGEPSARAVVDKHIALARDYELAADCNLLTPQQIKLMATADGRSAKGYCEGATAEVIDLATPQVRARAKALYSNATVKKISETASSAIYTVTSADGEYEETMTLTKVGDRWYVGSISDNGYSEDHDH